MIQMKNLSAPFDLIKKSVKLFTEKKNLLFFLKVYLPILPFSITAIVQNYLPAWIRSSTNVWVTVAFSAIQVLYLLTLVFVGAAGIVAVIKVVKGESLSVKATFASARRIYLSFLLLSIVLGIIEGLGFVLLIVPGLLFITWFAFSKLVMVDSNSGLKLALLKSKAMVKGIFWKVLARLAVFFLFMLAVELVLDIIPFGLGSAVISLSGALFILPTYLLYKELRG